MATMDITMARGLLMLTPVLMLMLSMVTMDMVLPTMVMDMVLPTTDTMDTHMLTMDTTMARDPLMPMLTTDTTHMLMDTTLMDMPTMDTMDTHMLMVTTDIINLLIFVKEWRSLLREPSTGRPRTTWPTPGTALRAPN